MRGNHEHERTDGTRYLCTDTTCKKPFRCDTVKPVKNARKPRVKPSWDTWAEKHVKGTGV
jgi:hypothetical protein